MVSQAKWEQLRARLASLGITEADLQEQFVRSGGKGGQNVNKVSTCVQLRHLPTGTEVKCQKSRYQADNRYLARQILANKIEAQVKGEASAEAKERFRIRKQKKRRSRRTKEKILADKRHQSTKKHQRTSPTWDD